MILKSLCVSMLLAVLIISATAPQSRAQLRQGDIFVIDQDAGTDSSGALFRVNPSTGARTLISDFADSSQGSPGVDPNGITIEPSGNILIVDRNFGMFSRGAMFRVNPSSGARTLISDFNDNTQGDVGSDPEGVVIGASGEILFIDSDRGTNFNGALSSVNPSDGSRTLISDFGDANQGSTGVAPSGIAIGALGNILVTDRDAGTSSGGALFSI